MEYLEGIKINDVDAIEKAGVDRSLLSTRTAECYLEQLIRHGFFHCDPHPGMLCSTLSPPPPHKCGSGVRTAVAMRLLIQLHSFVF